ncbi:MotA/TolQ/ExbB proton channel family protein [Limnohabitans sp. Rim47]|uniref:MotA/TolQ/ExbB proton channel family protein n=1 Tax=Limnohabitans sp. Rim47 TaxID=1100721 RepID=UPI000302F953|nr:MotA/TolQ/ExbB proton channel family protein [Limnohabitans sp. Rim47]
MLDALIVNAVLGILVLLSVVTWTVAWVKVRQDKHDVREMKTFEQSFFKVSAWSELPGLIKTSQCALARIAEVGVNAVQDLQDSGPSVLVDPQLALERALDHSMQEQLRTQERGLSELATIGSISPFVGLFGTVWGIMNALKHIGESGQASIDVVAGPVGEALIATAVGIAVAVPAVLFYNFLLRKQKLRVTQMASFADAFARLAMKHLSSAIGVQK